MAGFDDIIIKDKDFYLSFNGRLSRDRFLKHWFLPFFIIWLLTLLVGSVVHILPALFSILTLWPNMALNTRRLHDRGKSGWWQLLLLIPFIGFVWFIYEFLICTSQPGPNQYGPEPASVALRIE